MLTLASIIADINPQDVGQMLITLLAGGGVTAGSIAIARKCAVKIDNQPIEVRHIAQFATRDELNNLRDNVNRELGKHTEQLGEIKSTSAETKGYLKAISENQSKILDILMAPQK